MIESIRDNMTAVLEAMTHFVSSHSGEVPLYSREECLIKGEGEGRGIDTVDVTGPDYGTFLISNASYLIALPVFDSLAQNFIKDTSLRDGFRLGKEDSEIPDKLLQAYLVPLASHILENRQSHPNTGELLASSLRALDRFVDRDTFEAVFAAPLWNARCGVCELEIAEGIYLRRISDSQLRGYLNSFTRFKRGFELLELLSLEFELAKTVLQPRVTYGVTPMGAQIQESFEDVLKVMRVAKHGVIGIAFVHAQGIGFLGPEMTWTAWSGIGRVRGDPYELVEADLEHLRKILKANRLDTDPRFSLAMRRFMEAYHEPVEVDKLIDYWISLESLLLPDGKEGELRFRAALRAAFFAPGTQNREEVFRHAMKSYKARSDIVHGAKDTVDHATIVETEECLRRVLCRCLELQIVPTAEMLNSIVLGTTPLPSEE
jgi:hypothetical protein